MLIQFTNETSRATVGGNQSPGSHMRGDGGTIGPRNSAIQLPGCSAPSGAVAVSRVEETRPHQSFLSRCCAALIDIAAVFALVLVVLATGVGITFAGFVLLFCSL